MKKISRRQFLYFSTSLSLSYPLSIVVASSEDNKLDENDLFPITIAVLNSAYRSEIIASDHYVGYSRKAVEERYPNIAYLFAAFAVSEKIHAENYKKILASLNAGPEEPEFEIFILDTKANLISASEGELKKIKETYPDFLTELKKESHDKAVINCMYSWKSHRQHKRKISEIQKYSKWFFGSVAKKIEGMKFDFHVCEICGSTIDEAPKTPCDICNYPILHYHKVIKPA
ncbi:MAG: rubrerythrin family protein [Desulfobacterales bacterium]|nr:MAG: rubrerythrin family protein [Desulfobacterales bacterium]